MLLKLIFTDARNRLIYHQRTLITFARSKQDVLREIETNGKQYRSVRICILDARLDRAMKGLMP